MTVSVRSLETAVPATSIGQREVRDLFALQPGVSRLGRRLIHAVFDASAIDTRHTVLTELDSHHTALNSHHSGVEIEGEQALPQPAATPTSLFVDQTTGAVLAPSTGTRNQTYVEQSPALLLAAASRALEAATGVSAGDITHVITASCTGFYAPGPDYAIVRGLGLKPSTQRYHLGFMGCYAAFPALRAARDFCVADPSAVVLVVCVELCTIHLRSSSDPDVILASSVFADGAAAAVVSARPTAPDETVLDLDAFETVLTPTGEEDMAWTIGDAGFEMTLSSYVPRVIERHIRSALAPLLAADPAVAGRPYAEIERWAIHPGGRSILDKVQRNLGLTDEQLEPSREVLREYGNMSSATVLFVLQRILHKASTDADERVCAMAFGPGLTVETALMTVRTGS
jgi:predicted naringenin-chalcone synthase